MYQKAFLLKYLDTLDKFYTLNIEPNVKSDIFASITNNYDLREIPNHRFDNVEFGNVPCSVFLDPNLYPNLECLTKIVSLSIPNSCRRLIILVIKKTKWGLQFYHILKRNIQYYKIYTPRIIELM